MPAQEFHQSVDEISDQLYHFVHWPRHLVCSSELLHVVAVILKVCCPISEEGSLVILVSHDVFTSLATKDRPIAPL